MTHSTKIRTILLATTTLTLGIASFAPAAPPEGFERETWPGDWSDIIGIVPTGDGRYIAWAKEGLAWMVGPDGLASVEPILDLREEVGGWSEHGLMGFTLSPNFLADGRIFTMYAVDRHHLLFAGTPEYDPAADWYFAATIGRITRFELDPTTEFTSIVPDSRRVLLGESISTGLPIMHLSHGLGSLRFGSDGTLLAAMGDSATYFNPDLGGKTKEGWVPMALEDGIISPREDIGSFRAQLPDSLTGKILRLDPETGDGVVGNPYYLPEAPRIARSRVWALGLRNAFRFSVLPGTGSSDPSDADPGVLAIADVGWGTREEIALVDTPGANLGWPLFEGFDPTYDFWMSDLTYPLALNPLADENCPERYLYRDLLIEAGRTLSNPCDPSWRKPTAWDGPTRATNWQGWSGEDFLDFGGATGEWIDFELEVPAAGARWYGLRFANGGDSARPVEVVVDGEVEYVLEIAPTGGWIEWRIEWFQLDLPPGPHTVRIRTTINAGPNVDCLEAPELPYTPFQAGLGFEHRRPDLEYRHFFPEVRVPLPTPRGSADIAAFGDPDCPVSGTPFDGVSVTGGVAIDDARWPPEWRGLLFADYALGWMRILRLDQTGVPTSTDLFDNTAGRIVDFTHDPVSGDLLVVRYDQNPVRYSPPAIVCPADLDGDGVVSGGDIGVLLSNWGQSGVGDLDGDGVVDGSDFGLLLSAFGPCG
ncbi:MAG: PQQ-dependent sugar dehydrogenase [Planctomycetota bacterium]|nr:PQQ-dependent sugar dehydrogenase [Planctomycetota bacterium]